MLYIACIVGKGIGWGLLVYMGKMSGGGGGGVTGINNRKDELFALKKILDPYKYKLKLLHSKVKFIVVISSISNVFLSNVAKFNTHPSRVRRVRLIW